MNFEVDRYSSAWAHIALCADLTWASEPPDDFIIANQRLWAQHCRVSQVLQDSPVESQCSQSHNSCENNDKQLQVSRQTQENGGYSGRRSVKDVIPESRLAQYYGNFYYDELRERCYVSPNERTNSRGYNGQGCDNSDLTECWMLPEVEYWFRKLLDEPADRGVVQRRRRQFKIAPDVDFERWVSPGACAGEEAALAARVHAVKALWSSQGSQPQGRRTPSPPSQSRKIRARRRQPRRLAALAPPPPAYCLNVPAQLFCDPSCKFDTPRQPQLNECQRAMSRLSASVQAVMRASASRCPPYRGTNVSRYAPTSQRPARCPEKRYGVWWPRDHPAPKLDKYRQNINVNANEVPATPKPATPVEPETVAPDPPEQQEAAPSEQEPETTEPQQPEQKAEEEPDTSKIQKDQVVSDGQQPCTSAAAAAADSGLRKKRLYSTVLSMSAPAPMNLSQVGCVRLSQKLVTPGILKLNPKIVLPAARIRPPNVENKFEELEKEALEQYKASDESIDTKFRELEKQAVEQYSTSNSNTSCSSGNSAEKQTAQSTSTAEVEVANKQQKQTAKFHKEKAVDSVVIYSQNFPDLNQQKTHTNSEMNLKNFHTPPRGEKKEQNHRSSKNRSLKCESQRAASDTDYEARESSKGNHKMPMRWTLHVAPKKRHLTSCASDCSSDEELHNTRAIKDAGPRMKNHAIGKMKMSAHGAGDLHPIMRKT